MLPEISLDHAKGYLSGIKHRQAAQSGVRVFSYHNIVESFTDTDVERNFHTITEFESHLKFLKHYPVLSMDEYYDCIQTGTFPKKATVITFDDGYRNNLLACELLSKHHLPACFFITTSVIDTPSTIWTAELSLLLLKGPVSEVTFLEKIFPLRTPQDSKETFRFIRNHLKILPAIERQQAFQSLTRQFPPEAISELMRQFPSFQMLKWKEIKQMAHSGFTIGSHGVFHEIQHSHQDLAVIEFENEHSKSELTKKLAGDCHYIAYPNGNFTEHSLKSVEQCGYRLAFRTGEQTGPLKSRYSLGRWDPPNAKARLINRFYWK